MKNLKILICDDDNCALQQLSEHISHYMIQRSIPCELTVSTCPKDIMNSQAIFDLAFLDIQMDGVDGISLAKELKLRNSRLALFFITNYEQYQDDAMDLQAFRFFSKPIDSRRLIAGLDKAMEYIDGTYVDVVLCGDGVYKQFVVDNILYVMRDNRKVVLVATDGNYIVKEDFNNLCNKLPMLFFYLVHNSFFVNLHHVKTYFYSELTMVNGDRISIASRKQAAFRKFWFEYLRRR